METFSATLKREITHIRWRHGIWFETRHALCAYLFAFIEVFYNASAISWPRPLTPAEYAAQFPERPSPRVQGRANSTASGVPENARPTPRVGRARWVSGQRRS